MPVLEWLLAAGVGLAVGWYAGRWQKTAKLRHVVCAQMQGQYLGQILKDEPARRAAALAYLDPAKAAKELDVYPWDPLCIPTPFVGYAPAPSADPRLAVNSYQFRAKNEVAIPKPAGSVRVFLMGGSTAFSSGAPDWAGTIGGYLEAGLNKALAGHGAVAEVYTFAATAWSSTHERVALENRVASLEPDIVISLSGYNDAHWAWNSEDLLWLRAYFDRYYQDVIATAFAEAGEMLPKVVAQSKRVPEVAEVGRLLFRNVSLSLSAMPEHADYVFALQPFIHASGKVPSQRESAILHRWHPDQTAYYLDCYRCFAELLSGAAESKGFKFVDLTDVFKVYEKEEIFLDSSHFGDRGNAILARRLMDSLMPLVLARADTKSSV